MSDDGLSRRSFVSRATGTLGISWLAAHWPEIAVAAEHAHHAVESPVKTAMSFLTADEAAEVDAIAAQIIPTDETPGAHEAGVPFFVDRALATFLAHRSSEFRGQLTQFRADCSRRFPEARTFAELSGEQQIEFLRAVEHTPFFGLMHALTILGMFSAPAYGGNRDLVGWKLIGFEDRHLFEPPFGYYDRDYPGFAVTE